MELKLALQRIEPFESFVSETWCPPNLVPMDERMDKEFFESFLMDEFSEEVWDYFNTEFDDILCDMIGDISFVPKARYSLEESYEHFSFSILSHFIILSKQNKKSPNAKYF